MFDNLIARAIVPVTIAVTGFVIFGCLLLYSFVKADMTEAAFTTANNCADTVIKSTKSAMMEDDQLAIRDIVTNIGTRDDVKLIKIFDQKGNVRYSGNTGSEALAATVDSHIAQALELKQKTAWHEIDHTNGNLMVLLPIFNESKCSTAACHFHSEEDQILGFFSIGLSSKQLDKTLALLRNRMIVFSIMVLFLTIGGVTALLRMNLFLPILRLTYNAEQAAQGTTEAELPESDHKLGKLNKDFRRVVKQRDQALHDLQATSAGNVDDGSNHSGNGNTSA